MPGKTIQGTYWPSVTEVLEAVGLGPDFGFLKPGMRDYYLPRGRAVSVCIDYEADGVGYEAHEDVTRFLPAYRNFCLAVPHSVVASEVELIDPTWRYVGHPDRVAKFPDGRLVLVDWKLSFDREAARRQLAGYSLLWLVTHPQESLSERWIVELKPEGRFAVHPLDVGSALQVFKACLIVWWARADGRVRQ